MVNALVEIDEETNRILNLVKARHGLNDKGEAIAHVARQYEERRESNKLVSLIELAKKQWYVQTFTGTPLLLFSAASSGFYMKEKTGLSYSAFIHTFKKDLGEMYYSLDDLKEMGKKILDNLNKDKNYLDKVRKLYLEDQEEYLDFYKELEKKNLSQLNDKGIKELISKSLWAVKKGVGIAHIIEAYSLTTDEPIKKELSNYIKDEKDINKVFILLTSPTKKSFVNESEEFLIETAKADAEKRDKMILEYLNRFGWVRNSYAGKKWLTKGDIYNELDSYKDKKSTDFNRIIQEKKEAIKRYNLPEETVSKLKNTEFMTSWQDERKKFILLGIDCLENLLKELSLRVNIPIELLRYSTPDEICGDKPLKSEILEERRSSGVLLISRPPKNAEKEFENTILLSGEDYQEAIKLLKNEEEIKVRSINGSPASLGYAIGKARVVLHPENAEFQKGEILVTGMTRPEFLPLMKKASAIVTDEGGITSHAAIVARELNIPCIIGTKIATKAIRTGDLIEVKASHGLIKILERAK